MIKERLIAQNVVRDVCVVAIFLMTSKYQRVLRPPCHQKLTNNSTNNNEQPPMQRATFDNINKFFRHLTHLLMLIAVSVLYGCASGMSKEECQTADWELIGYGDGSKGYSSSRIDQHRKDCAGVSSPVLAEYLRGYDRGLVLFCTELNGYKSGKSGSALSTVCAGPQADQFHAGYEFGHRLYLANVDVRRLIKNLTDSKQQRVNLEYRIGQLENELIQPGRSASQRAEVILHLKRERDQLGEWDNTIAKQERKLRHSLGAVNEINRHNPYEQIPDRDMPDIRVKVKLEKPPADHHSRERRKDEPRITIRTTP